MIIHLILGGIAGFLANKVIRGKGYGVMIDVLLGLAGGWIGGCISDRLNLRMLTWGYFLTPFLGAVLLVWMIRLVRK
ncbi:GlsB/YeaQ/YmgE family stress response membrane protein [Mucilaginibacter sp. FT3.2]|uniref:GlsB/YeaQ/YmgE family stress response membrane protein n=1 Tax=Mucilaginibacter sp. FT3.2 TaxID=2723090 RepID=UPI00160AAB9F|nr:GlsB/YeaQ/YmgE family stress response membrane protein [Mucilaginibacter sp. FT3.2]MBB6234957.1 putative membrane protein YeaQ/YmgE (transglycosylase-associated protein family) [Mucilaginibacter sp. FT3.2]